jgi:hypothetical protein
MAIAFRAAASNTSFSTTSVVVSKPTGTVENDFLLAYAIAMTGTTLAPSGTTWTERFDLSGSGSDVSLYSRLAGASEPSTYTFAGSSTTDYIAGVIAFSGVDTTTPINASGSDQDFDTTITLAEITTTVDNTMLVAFMTAENGVSISSVPSGYTSVFAIDNGDDVLTADYLAQATAGGSGSFSWTVGSGSALKVCAVALAPAAAAGGLVGVGLTQSILLSRPRLVS